MGILGFRMKIYLIYIFFLFYYGDTIILCFCGLSLKYPNGVIHPGTSDDIRILFNTNRYYTRVLIHTVSGSNWCIIYS